MSLNQRPKVAYGLSQPDFAVGPIPIVTTRPPTTADFAEIGTLWVNTATAEIWALVSIISNIAGWMPLGTVDYGLGLDGQTLIAATGGVPIWNTITPGVGIDILNTPNNITISLANPSGLAWNTNATVGPIALAVNNGYVLTNAAAVMLTLPAVAALGSQIYITTTDAAAGGFQINQNAGQNIVMSDRASLVGVGVYVNTTAGLPVQYQTMILICTTVNTQWTIFECNCPNLFFH